MERLTEKKRNSDGTGISKKSLVVEYGMRQGLPSNYCCAIVSKLAEYEELEEQGLLLKLPCKVGDTVYTLNTLLSGKTIIGELQADAFFLSLCTMENRFGKTVFLTQPEAEEALRDIQREIQYDRGRSVID